MSLIDFILNLAGLLLWLNWRAARLALGRPKTIVSIANAIQRVEAKPVSGWGSLGALGALLLLRGLVYHSLGPKLGWVPQLDFVVVNLPWRSDDFYRIQLYSVISFGVTLFVFYAWLLLLSAVNRSLGDKDPVQRWIRQQLGVLERLPSLVKGILPLCFIFICWVPIYKGLVAIGIAPEITDPRQLWQSSGVIALGSVLIWRWLLVVLFTAHLLNTYLYLGEHPFWTFASSSTNNLLGPLKLLRLAKVDLAPVIALVFVLLLARVLPIQLTRLYQSLPW